jgi:hypothetical protein
MGDRWRGGGASMEAEGGMGSERLPKIPEEVVHPS